LGLIVAAILEPGKVRTASTSLYSPSSNTEYFTSSKYLWNFGIYDVVDIFMVLYMYSYIIYVLYIIGFFGVLQRLVRNVLFQYHDHLFDFLVEKMDVKVVGLENIFMGFQLIQQWDDILKIQRRYALLTWPDVRPPYLVPFAAKVAEIKWASMFNLTLKNVRSSLGLTLLHTAMFSANSEAAKWLMNSNPELLSVQDSQNDTPVSIALKECAYFLLAYGQQNEGQLDDGTSYTDEKYGIYYPEVEDIRESVFQRGEFLEDRCTVNHLTSKDVITLSEEGYYVEPVEEVIEEDDYIARGRILSTGTKRQQEQLAAELERRADLDRKRRRLEQRLEAHAAAERKAMHALRFPEDASNDNMESGQLASWQVLGLSVSDVNIFLDGRIFGKLSADAAYKYDQMSESIAMDLQYVVKTSSNVRYMEPQDCLVP